MSTPVKYDDGKPVVVQGFMRYFPRAIEAVARVSEYGYTKYKAWGGWRKTEAMPRYLEAMQRHVLAWQSGESHDPESGLWHMQHAAWNAMAILQLMIDEGGAPPSFKPYREPRALAQADRIVRGSCPDTDDLWCDQPGADDCPERPA